jgi:SAM-dependent methyltransferase
MADRLVWTPTEVVDVDGPRAMLRAYLEQRDVRTLLATRHRSRVPAACDVGCGFGRLTSLLGEFATTVVGFEREPGLVATARALMPAIEVRAIERLASLPAPDASFDIALVFTVLQHVPEPAVRDVVAEILRVVKPDGTILLCEETDITLEAGDRAHADLGYTCGRAPEVYSAWLAPWRFVAAKPRVIEPDYPRLDVGSYMLFVGPESAWSGVPSR